MTPSNSSPFAWREQQADPELRAMNNATKTHMAIARTAWARRKGGVIPVRGIDIERHGGAYMKAKA